MFDPEKVHRFCITRDDMMSFKPEMAVNAADYDRLLELYRALKNPDTPPAMVCGECYGSLAEGAYQKHIDANTIRLVCMRCFTLPEAEQHPQQPSIPLGDTKASLQAPLLHLPSHRP